MRILITGGFGFIGARLAVNLAYAGHEIILGTRHEKSPPEWLSQAKVVKIVSHDDLALDLVCEGVDLIIHTAGMNAQDCVANPIAALSFNGVHTSRLVEAASRMSVSKFIYLSTAHIYASPLVGVITEETCPSNLHPYATSHLAGERAVLWAANNRKFQGAILRLSNVFGAPIHKNVNCWMLLANDLCKQAVQTRKLVLQTSGLQQRNFIGLKEACRVIQAVAVDYDGLGQANIFNVGTSVSQSVLAMAKLIQKRCIEVLGYEPVLEFNNRGEEGEGAHYPLAYSSDKLSLLGITCKNLYSMHEIDELLIFCKTEFK